MKRRFTLLWGIFFVISTFAQPILDISQSNINNAPQAEPIQIEGKLTLKGTNGAKVESHDGNFSMELYYGWNFSPFPLGTYDSNDVELSYSLINIDGGWDNLQSAEFTISQPDGEDGDIILEGTFVTLRDGITYEVHAVQRGLITEPEEIITIKATNLQKTKADYGTGSTMWDYTASNSQYELLLVLNADAGDGIYNHTHIYSMQLTDVPTGKSEFISNRREAQLTFSDNMTKLVGYVLTDDAIRYDLDLSFVKPDYENPLNTYEIVFQQEGNYEPHTDMEAFQMQSKVESIPAVSEEHDVMFHIAIASAEVVGEYTMDDVLTDATQLVIVKKETEEPVRLIHPYAIRAKIEQNDIFYTCYIQWLSVENELYNITLNVPRGMKHDSRTENINRTYNNIDDKVELVYEDEMGVAFLEIWGTEPADYANIAFLLSEPDPVTILPAGTYPINDTEEENTVKACPGVLSGSLIPSYYGGWKDGGIANPYFFVSGTVKVDVVDGLLKVVVDALNSYDRTIHIEYAEVATSICNTQADEEHTTKLLGEDGTIYILRNGQVYTIQGALVK